MPASARSTSGLQMLQTLFDAARVHGTEVRLTPAAVPTYWDGPALTRGPDVAAFMEAEADHARPLGQLPLV